MSSLEATAPGVPNPALAQNVEAPRFSRQVTLLTMLSVLLVMILASLDQTIVGTALPRIVADLQGTQGYTAVTTAYLLTSTVMIPIYGKLSDLYGRKPIMIFALTVFLLGSALCGTSQNMTMLILFRGFQGLGAGGLMSMAIAIIGDLFSPRERAKWQGLIGAVFGATFILGPTVGGWLTDNGWLLGTFITATSRWRWIFYVNLPLGIVAMFVLIFLMPTLRPAVKNAKIDFVGAVLLILGVVPLLLGFNWAGSQYAWNSPQTIGLFAGAVVFLGAFFIYEALLERRGGQPTIEPGLFRSGIFTISVIVAMLSNMALIGSISFIPLFVQGIVGTNATNSGVILTPLMLTAITSSILSGFLVSRFGTYKVIALVGGAIALVGSATMLRLGVASTNQDVVISMLVLGLGVGFSLSLYNLIVQNAFPNKIGQVSSSMTFFRQIGSTIGLAAMGSILSSTYTADFANPLPATVTQTLPTQAVAVINSPNGLLYLPQLQPGFAALGPQGLTLYTSLQQAMKSAVSLSIHNIFLLSVGLATVGLLVLFFLKEVPLRGGTAAARTAEALGAEVPADADADSQLVPTA
jgi:EmrB/QacA subfamily drug resistance transporter